MDLRDEFSDINYTVLDKIVSYFTNTPILYCYSQMRAGPGRMDFTIPEPHYIQPAASNGYKGNLIVLVNHYTGDAGELMANAFKQIPETKTVGIKTSGVVSSASTRELPDGSYYTIPTIRYLDANKQVLESNGIVPDIIVSADTDTIWNAHDEILDSAIAIFKRL
jgi:carboxyl-terminal processing protease